MSRLKSHVTALSVAAGVLALAGCSSDPGPVLKTTSDAASTTAESAPAIATEDSTATEGTDTGGTDTEAGAHTELPADCNPTAFVTKVPRTLTFATVETPAEPWFLGGDPMSADGFEGAVAYAIAERLGYHADQVSWLQLSDAELAGPGEKAFDLAVAGLVSGEVNPEDVDVTAPYLMAGPVVVSTASNTFATAGDRSALEDARFGVVGQADAAALSSLIDLGQAPQVFADTAAATAALTAGDLDALAVDLPTALRLSAGQAQNAVIVGQLPADDATADGIAVVLEKDSAMTSCADTAVAALRADGVLDDIAARWLVDGTGAPVLN